MVGARRITSRTAISYCRAPGSFTRKSSRTQCEVHGMRCTLTTCKCQELYAPENNAAAGCMIEIKCKEIIECCCIYEVLKSEIKANHVYHTAACEWLYFVVCRAGSDLLVGRANMASWKCSTTCWLSPILPAC